MSKIFDFDTSNGLNLSDRIAINRLAIRQSIAIPSKNEKIYFKNWKPYKNNQNIFKNFGKLEDIWAK